MSQLSNYNCITLAVGNKWEIEICPIPKEDKEYGEDKEEFDQYFVTKVSGANLFEILKSRLALTKKTSSYLQKVARTIIKDHSNAGNKLKYIASNHGLQVAKQLDADHVNKLKLLESNKSKEFERLYYAIQVDAHREAIALFQKYADKGTNSALVAFARETLPALRNHLALVEKGLVSSK